MNEPKRWLKPFFKGGLLMALLGGCRQVSLPVPPSSLRPETLLVSETIDPLEYEERWRRSLAAYVAPRVFRLEVRATYRYTRETTRGTAWLFDTAGHLFTCRHVFPTQASRLEVEVWDAQGTCYPAEVVWRDTVADVAILSSALGGREGLPLKPEETAPEIGQTVVSMGAPWGLMGTLQEGFVAAPLRQLEVAPGATLPFLQLSLPAQSGSSGSPVLDRRGHVVGMVSDIATTSGLYEGISFAIPASVLWAVWTRYRRFAHSYDTTGSGAGD